MFNLQGSEIIFILLLALVVLGPEKLPGAIRRFTRTYAELRKMGTSFQDEVRSAFEEPMREVRETADLIKQQVDVEALEAEHGASTALDQSAGAERSDLEADDSSGCASGPDDVPDALAPPKPGAPRVVLPEPALGAVPDDVPVPDAAGVGSHDDVEAGVDEEVEPGPPARPVYPTPPPPFSASPRPDEEPS